MDLGFSKRSTTEASAEKLRQLSEEVNRIAGTLARLAILPAVAKTESDEAFPVKIERVRKEIEARRLRSKYFDSALFAEPAWDMLLDLFQNEISQLRVPVSSLCVGASVPPTTALRWINNMTDAGLFVRHPDPCDGRRVFVELTPKASEAMRRYFTALLPQSTS
jgi:DNA-binding MarR family transcriptional regulator